MLREESGNFNSTEYKRNYNERTYDRLNIVVPKGRKEQIEALAGARGLSVNGMIGALLRRELGMTEAEWRGSGTRAARKRKDPSGGAREAEEDGTAGEKTGTYAGETLPVYLL